MAKRKEAGMSDALQTVWTTKYALTEGVREAELLSEKDGYAYVRTPTAPSYGAQMGKSDWHRSKEAALARAEEMRLAKIASYEKSIAKLRKLSFS